MLGFLCSLIPLYKGSAITPIIGVVAHKGGVGKSTLASNLTAALAREGSVTLIDADT